MRTIDVVQRYVPYRSDLLPFAARVDGFFDEVADRVSLSEPAPAEWLELRSRAAEANLLGIDLDESRGGLGLGSVAVGIATMVAGMRAPDELYPDVVAAPG